MIEERHCGELFEGRLQHVSTPLQQVALVGEMFCNGQLMHADAHDWVMSLCKSLK